MAADIATTSNMECAIKKKKGKRKNYKITVCESKETSRRSVILLQNLRNRGHSLYDYISTLYQH